MDRAGNIGEENDNDQLEDESLMDEGQREASPNPTVLKKQKPSTAGNIANDQENTIQIRQVKNSSKDIGNSAV
jgi:hypothetical protein